MHLKWLILVYYITIDTSLLTFARMSGGDSDKIKYSPTLVVLLTEIVKLMCATVAVRLGLFQEGSASAACQTNATIESTTKVGFRGLKIANSNSSLGPSKSGETSMSRSFHEERFEDDDDDVDEIQIVAEIEPTTESPSSRAENLKAAVAAAQLAPVNDSARTTAWANYLRYSCPSTFYAIQNNMNLVSDENSNESSS